jgi:hypothetical protein
VGEGLFRKLAGTVLAGAAIAICAAPGTAAAQSTTGSDVVNATVGFGAGVAAGQTFTVPAGTDTFFHSLRITGSQVIGTGTIKVTAVDGSGLPTGAALFTSSTIPARERTPLTVYPNITLTAGQQYAFYAEPISGSLGGFAFDGSNMDVYAGGKVVKRAGATWAEEATQEIAFLASFNTGRTDTATTISCPGPTKVGVATACTATLKDAGSGAGLNGLQVVLSSLSGSGSFSDSCFVNASGTCSFNFTPTQAGADTLFGQFVGDATHLGSGANTGISPAKRTSAQSGAGCTPTTVQVGQAVTCFVTVSDTDTGTTSTPVGAVSWSSTGAGAFAGGGACSLTADTLGVAKCVAIPYTPTAPGAHQISAAYGGDGTHLASASASAGTVTVLAPPVGSSPVDCGGVRAKIAATKRKLRKADGAKSGKLKKKLKRLRRRAAAIGC